MWDAFISHSSEDKAFVRALAEALRRAGLDVWYDEFTLEIGDSLRESIDKGLARARFGILVLSTSFFTKKWPQNELNGLFAREISGQKIILPVWHDIDSTDVLKHSPMLADRVAVRSSEGLEKIVNVLIGVIKPEVQEINFSQQRARDAVQHLQTRLEKGDPRFRYQLSLGEHPDVDLDVLDLFRAAGSDPAKSTTRINVIAHDRESLEKNPPKVTIGFKAQTAIEKLKRVIELGTTEKFDDDELSNIKSDFDFLFPSAIPSNRRLVIGPSAEIRKALFRWKLTFRFGGESLSYDLVEFKVLRLGTKEIELKSTSQIPFELSLVIRPDGTPTDFSTKASYQGFEISKVWKASKALRMIKNGGAIEIYNLELDAPGGILQLEKIDSTAEDWLDVFVDALYEISKACGQSVSFGEHIRREDLENVLLLQAIVRGETVQIQTDWITLPLTKWEQYRKLSAAVDMAGGITLTEPQGRITKPVFGTNFDIGPCRIHVVPTKLDEVLREQDFDGREIPVRVLTSQSIVFEFPKWDPAGSGVDHSAKPS